MRSLAIVMVFLLSLPTALAQPRPPVDGPPVQVMILGVFHFENPGRDIANIQVDDVLSERRQAEIRQILDGLAQFKPTKIAVESQKRQPGTLYSERYPLYRAGTLPPSGNEVVQVGFALAKRLGHPNVYSVDVDGDFPFDPVMDFAQKSGRGPRLMAQIDGLQKWTAKVSADLKTQSLGQVLRQFNDPAQVAFGNEFYLDLLHDGTNDEQPGAALVASWYKRNFEICARIVQSIVPGDRVLVIYGSGHAYLLRHCLGGMPGYSITDVNAYLPN